MDQDERRLFQAELQAEWARPGVVLYEVIPEETWQLIEGSYFHGPGVVLGWRVTRPVKMWLGRTQTHQYGCYVYEYGTLSDEEILEALGILREQFDETVAVLDLPAWRRLLFRIRRRGWSLKKLSMPWLKISRSPSGRSAS